MPLDPRLERAVRERLGRSAFRTWMGFELLSLDDGASELRLEVDAHHLNPGGLVHGGVLATMLDAAIGLALRTRLGPRDNHVTLQMDVHFLSPVRSGAVIARGRAVQTGGRASYGEGELRAEDGRLVARGSGSFLVVRDGGSFVVPDEPGGSEEPT